jgi:hypothetical protein
VFVVLTSACHTLSFHSRTILLFLIRTTQDRICCGSFVSAEGLALVKPWWWLLYHERYPQVTVHYYFDGRRFTLEFSLLWHLLYTYFLSSLALPTSQCLPKVGCVDQTGASYAVPFLLLCGDSPSTA